MNIARLFSYTLRVEAERDEWKARAEELDQKLEKRTSYAFALAGRPTPEAVEARQAGAGGGEVKPLPPRPNLRLLRRRIVNDIIARREPSDGAMKSPESSESRESGESMGARADEFAEKVKDGTAS